MSLRQKIYAINVAFFIGTLIFMVSIYICIEDLKKNEIKADILNTLKTYEYMEKNRKVFSGDISDKIEGIKRITGSKKAELYLVSHNNNSKHYHLVEYKKVESVEKKRYIEAIQNIRPDKTTDNFIIAASRSQTIKLEELKNHIIYYIPKKSKILNSSWVIKLTVNKTILKEDMTQLIHDYIYFGVALLIFYILLFYLVAAHVRRPITTITEAFKNGQVIIDRSIIQKNDEFGMLSKTYNKLLDDLQKEIEINKNLLKEHSDFIANTVHQMRSYFSTIKINLNMIDRSSCNEEIKKHTQLINSTMKLLSSSYEDLSYIVNNKELNYEKLIIDIGCFVSSRIKFFESMSLSYNKKIIAKLDKECLFEISDLELERIIDNNLANALKYSYANKNIAVTLKKIDDKITLTFSAPGNPIKKPSKIFDKYYREASGSRGLGLGLFIVKQICEKYDIQYNAEHKNGENIFKYEFYPFPRGARE